MIFANNILQEIMKNLNIRRLFHEMIVQLTQQPSVWYKIVRFFLTSNQSKEQPIELLSSVSQLVSPFFDPLKLRTILQLNYKENWFIKL